MRKGRQKKSEEFRMGETDVSTPTLLRLILRKRGGLALDVLQHGENLWPGQKARTQRLILDALCQPSDDPRRLSKCRVRLRRLAPCLIQRPQRRLDLPLFCWQAERCGQSCCLAQVADGLLAVSLPRGEHRQRLQVRKAEARGRPQTFSESLHFCSRLAFIPPTQQ